MKKIWIILFSLLIIIGCSESSSNQIVEASKPDNSSVYDFMVGKGNDNKSESGNGQKYWVDINNIKADDNNSGDKENPWKTLTRAMNVAKAGDTVYVMPGVYTDNTTVNNNSSMWQSFPPKNSGEQGNPITFKSVIPRAAILKSKNPSEVIVSRDKALAFYSKTDIIFDGFKAIGMVQFTDCQRVNFINGEVTLGSIAWDDPSLLWGVAVERSHNCVVRNNKIHSMGATYVNGVKYQKHNQAGIMVFGEARDNLIEFNDLDMNNNVYAGLGNKAGNLFGNVWKNNFVKNSIAGVFSKSSTDLTRLVWDSYYYNNVFLDNDYGIIFDSYTKNSYIVNNTVVNSNIAAFKIGALNSTNMVFVNNLIINAPKFLVAEGYYGSEVEHFKDLFKLADYNSFYNINNGFALKEASPKQDIVSLNDYKKFGIELNSKMENPEFLNIDGKTVESFKRKSYPKDGAGTKYFEVRGAYTKDNDIVGNY